MVKFHTKHTPSLRCGTKLGCISEHLSQRHHGPYRLRITGTNIHSLNQTSTTIELSHNIAKIFLRYYYFDFHHGFKKNRITLVDTFFKTHGSS